MTRVLILIVMALAATWSASAQPWDVSTPVPVSIEGYDGHAMEPFLSRNGEWLFFNNRNQPDDQTDIHLARRLTATRFAYVGPLHGANSPELDGVPSMDVQGAFYFVSPRAYDETRNTLWQGVFADGEVSAVTPLRGESWRNRPLWLNMDAEISADGQTLYFTENRWRLFGGGIQSSNIVIARRDDAGAFQRPDNAESLFEQINTNLLEFAPALTPDELTLYFTRVDRAALDAGRPNGFGIFAATRNAQSEPFGPPQRIEAINGYVEAPTLSPDGCGIYFHKRVNEVFEIQLARRTDCPEP